jgi:hypothetical protein
MPGRIQLVIANATARITQTTIRASSTIEDGTAPAGRSYRSVN